MTRLSCPTCAKPLDPVASTALPFCSDRCRQIDLRRWLGEGHSLPVETGDPEEQPPEDEHGLPDE